ncbi:MAG: helix-turn-helix transcriptional regulator [Saprospiraceae bacterium]|nr:helix-turn-helix transcriptional regulator [Saprospiraceae bacterium]
MISGQLLKFYREAKNLSPESLAEVIQVDYRTYLKIENGTRDMKVSELLKLSVRLEIDPEKLLDEKSTSNSFNQFTNSNYSNNYGNNITVSEEMLITIKKLLESILKKMS